MKHFFASALSVCLLCAAPLLAQPVLNLSGIPPFGSELTSSSVDGTGITLGSGGANQTWNFTAYPDTGAPVSFTYVDPSTTPFAADFPASNYAFESQVIDGSTNYGFYDLNAASFSILGNATLGADLSEQVISYSDPEKFITFPASFNSTSNDNYSLSFQNDVFTINSTGTSSYVVDAYGTLTTASGTYPNILRFKRRRVSTSSSITPFGTFDTESQSTAYEYVRVANAATITVWSITYDTTQSALTGSTTALNVNHTTGSNLTQLQAIQAPTFLSTYPNPASNTILFMLPQDAQVSVFDLSGRVVATQAFSLNGGAMPIMDVSSLPSGTYLVKAEGEDYAASAKIVVLH